MSKLLSIYSKQSPRFASLLGVFISFFVFVGVLGFSESALADNDFSVICQSRNLSNAEVRTITTLGGGVAAEPEYEGSGGRPRGFRCLVPAQVFPDELPPSGGFRLVPDVQIAGTTNPGGFDGEVEFSEDSLALIFAGIKFFAINFVLWQVSRIF